MMCTVTLVLHELYHNCTWCGEDCSPVQIRCDLCTDCLCSSDCWLKHYYILEHKDEHPETD